jgi:ABC-type transport system involved in cytochrome c biogenesis ATPase subunit
MATARVVPSGGTSLLLEREVQVAALQALVDAAKSGGGRFVVIEGTAGIGKTRLLAGVAVAMALKIMDHRSGGVDG